MEMDFVLIGKRIKQIRISKGITQVSLANMLDCDPCYVSKLESGSKKTSISRIVAVADALEVSVDDKVQEALKICNFSRLFAHLC